MFCLLPAAQAQKVSIITFEYADSLCGRTENGIQYRELNGHVIMHQDRVRITCDRAIQNITGNSAELIGNVVIRQDTLTMRTNRGMYYGNTRHASTNDGIRIDDGHVVLTADAGQYHTSEKVALFSSRVQVEDSVSTILCRDLRYERDSSKAIASGDVVIIFKHDNATITGDTAIHYHKRNISIFPRNPWLMQTDSVIVRRDSLTGKPDSVRIDTLTILSARMEGYRDSTNHFIADQGVEIVRGRLAARCEHLDYKRNDSLIILRTAPIAWYEDNQVTGDSMAVQLADGKVHTMDVTGNAMAISRSKPSEKDTLYPPGRFDQSKGNSIHLLLKDNKAERIRIERQAVSLYYLYDGRSLNGVRRESGDLVIIDFVDGKADEIRSIGGVEGKYWPEKMVTGVETGFNLEGFLWRNDRPVLDTSHIRSHITGNH
jgi:lipopolysaccharide export system protein LptA